LDFEYPKSTHRQNGENGLKKWITLQEAVEDIMYLPLINIDWAYKKQNKETLQIMDIGGRIFEKRWTTYMHCHPPLELNRPSKTLLTNPSDFLIPVAELNGEPVYRKLTVREFLRIQTFPDWWEYPEDCPITQRYRLIGEAVPPLFAYHLATAVSRTLNLKINSLTEEQLSLPFYNKIF
jgi:DNA (cytosine-5)-methyltransferase 1